MLSRHVNATTQDAVMTGTLPVNSLEDGFKDMAHQSTRTLQSDVSQGRCTFQFI